MKRLGTLLCLLALCVVAAGPADARTHDAQPTWWGGTFAVSGGEQLHLYISTRYPRFDATTQKWVEFFSSIPHSWELSLVTVYIAPLDEIAQLCGNGEALGCYRANAIYAVGAITDGVAPTSVVAHEYGHHIAANRSNPPWRAVDWGTKRWATQVGVCSRVANGLAFPGNEGYEYTLNPGEAFAESYRVLVETHGTAVGYDWSIVDQSFRPTAESLAALQEDIVHPWPGPTKSTVRGKFLRRGRTWITRIATPLDGDLRVRVTVPGGGADDVTLLTGDGQTVLATGSWTTSGAKSVEYRICGARSFQVRVTRGAAAARFTLHVERP
jgi:hypothetical protein